MGGPSVTRLNPAPQPGLTQPGINLLQSIFGGGSAPSGGAAQQGGGRSLFGAGGSTPFGRLGGLGANNFLQGLGGTGTAPASGASGGMAPGADILSRIQSVFGLNNFGMQGPNPGQGVVDAYQPIFQRNLALAQDTGPRFSSGNAQLRGQALNDYNMFAQNALMQGYQTQLQGALAGQGQELQTLMPLLQALFTGGGINAQAAYNVSPGFGSQLAGLAGTLGGAALGGPFGAALGGSLFGGAAKGAASATDDAFAPGGNPAGFIGLFG